MTTLKIGGIANKLYFPKNIAELTEAVSLANNEYYLLGRGSNLLINDKKEFPHVISLKKMDKFLTFNDDGKVIKASAACSIQELLRFAIKNSLGGAEYLYSLPAEVGGIVAMNAGRGRGFNQSIADFIMRVEILDENGTVRWLRKDECAFKYRESIFHKQNNWVILSVEFKFNEQDSAVGKELIKTRMEYQKNTQDAKLGNAGSVFKKSSGKVMSAVRKLPKRRKGCYFSSKTNNWMLNDGTGTYQQARKNIDRVKLLHKLLGKKCEVEWIIWE